METPADFDDCAEKRKPASQCDVTRRMMYVAIINPAALFSLRDFCLAPETTKFSKEQFNLLVENGLLCRDSSVPFNVRTLIQNLGE
jgi:hypothetical protein